MEDLTLPSVASKNGGVVHPFFQKPWPIFQTSRRRKKFKLKNIKKMVAVQQGQLSTRNRQPVVARRPRVEA
jgi:hypothetical protein